MDKPTIRIGARVEADLVEDFTILAAANNRSFSSLLRQAMREIVAAAQVEVKETDRAA